MINEQTKQKQTQTQRANWWSPEGSEVGGWSGQSGCKGLRNPHFQVSGKEILDIYCAA